MEGESAMTQCRSPGATDGSTHDGKEGSMSAKCYVGRRRQMTVQDWARLGWDQEHAERYALLDETTAEVVVLEERGVRPLAHHVRHSPDGFSWGYAGSGPSELARCILLDHFDLPGDTDTDSDSPRLPVSYQRFKFDVIARLAQHDPWSISSHEIGEWVAHQQGTRVSPDSDLN
jgi:hypothetical protein